MKYLHLFIVGALFLGAFSVMPVSYTSDNSRMFWLKLKCFVAVLALTLFYLYCISSDAPFVDKIYTLLPQQPLEALSKPE